MAIELHGTVLFVGNYGSGKTEVAINFAVYRRRTGMTVRIADLDLVNPYFRTREARSVLAGFGIEVVLPPAMYMQADLPILTPAVAGMLRRPGELDILDVGGDDAGSTVLSSLADLFQTIDAQVIQVINPFRPFTDTIGGCLRIRDEIEQASRLKITALVGNANLIDQTSADDIVSGLEFVRRLADESGLPLLFITAPVHLMDEIQGRGVESAVLPIERQLVPPWKAAVKMGPRNFRLHRYDVG